VAAKPPKLSEPEPMQTYAKKFLLAAEAYPSDVGQSPYIPALKTQNVALGTAIGTAQGGTDSAQLALLTATRDVRDTARQHVGWLQGQGNGMSSSDAIAYFTKAGAYVAQEAVRTPLTAPELSNAVPKVIQFHMHPIPNYVMAFAEISMDQGKTYVRGTETHTVKGEITGLTSGQEVFVRLRAYTRDSGYTQWWVLSIIVT
jgi:hypothetical protein